MPQVKVRMVTEHGGHRVLLATGGTHVETPPVEHVLFYAALGTLAAIDVIEWPLAIVLMAGHALLDLTSRPGLMAVGEALEEA